ncbi:M1 family metallopeptidase [Algoriphagus marinus]|uniref:M1 family metallopeptidase n=1 Tax=Algoriphagus marinus TaxID=1925762 RepID=UPI0009FAC7C9|nr:M1 family metallopeptidase [Algoriphagus marinus]
MKQIDLIPQSPSKILPVLFIFLMGSGLYSCKSKAIIQNPQDIQEETVNVPATLTSTENNLKEIEQIQLQKELEIESYRASQPRRFDIIHTTLDLAFDYQNQSVIGKAELKIKPFKYPQKVLFLNAQDFEVGEIMYSGGEEKRSLDSNYDGQELTIYLPEELSEKDTFEIIVEYIAFPNRNPVGGSEAITDTKGLYFIDPLDTIPGKPTMVWTQGETMHNSKWFPTIDHPNERFTQKFNLTVPDSLVTISNGELVSQKKLENGLRVDSWEMKLPHAPYLAALAIGDFGKVNDSWEGIQLGYFVEKGFEKGAEKVFENTPEMIGFFSKLTGVKFPWPKYDQVVVRDFVSGAMENTTASIFMEELQLTAREAIDSEWDYIIAHELFHQWFGDYVTAESWSNLTLNEAFANYSEFLWNEFKYGEDQAKLKLIAETENYFAEAEFKKVDLIRFQYADDEDMFDSHSYSKGGFILHMLREFIGKEVFYEGLTTYLTTHAFQSVEVHDLRLAMEKVSGQDLNWFFNQWFLDKGHPELSVEFDYSSPGNVKISVSQTQDLEEFPLFQLPIEISWYVNENRFSKKVFLNKANQDFILEIGESVDQVFFDEKKNLLAAVAIEKSAKEYLQQFEISEVGIARYEALDSLMAKEAIEELQISINQAISDDFWAIRESGLRILQGNTSWLDQDSDLEEMIYSMAEKDPKNSVRAGALDVLAEYNPVKYQNLFKMLANDSSYLVAGSALMGLMSEEIDLEEEFVERFSAETNFRIVIPMADFYIIKAVKGKGDWFQFQLSSLSGEGLYFFLGYYGEYFSRFPEEGKPEAIAKLFEIMERNSKSFIRLGAFQALLAFTDEEAVVKEMSRLADLETDLELKMYYQYFLEAIKSEN